MLRVLGLQREVVLIAVTEMLVSAIGIYAAFWSTAPAIFRNIPLTDRVGIVLLPIVCFGMVASILGLYRSSTITDLHNLVTKSFLIVFLGILGAAAFYHVAELLITTDMAPMLDKGAAFAGARSAVAGGAADLFLQGRDGESEVRASANLILAAIAVPLTWFICLVASQTVFSVAFRRHLFGRRIVIIVAPNDLGRFEPLALDRRHHRFGEIQLVPLHSLNDAASLAAPPVPKDAEHRRVSTVVVTAESSRALPASVLLDLRLRGFRVLSEAAFWEREVCWIDIDSGDLGWLFGDDGFRYGRVADAVKRMLDLSVATLLIALALPVMALVAILIKLESSGDILYRQERTGLRGRPFVLYKFRSMRPDAEAAGIPQWATVSDPRITRIGRFIRYTRIDELPQLVNVLRGEMSMVGPRPERPYFVEQLATRIPFYRQRHCVKPGITGWAQINAPYGASLEEAREKLRYDLYYAKNRSFLLDLWILLCTIRVVLFREGAR